MYFPFTFNKSASSKLDQTFPTPTYHPGIGGVKSCGGQDEEQWILLAARDMLKNTSFVAMFAFVEINTGWKNEVVL